MEVVSKDVIDKYRKEYPKSCRIKLVSMDDRQAPPKGTYGTVYGVDDIGTLLVTWDNGSTLGVILGYDVIQKI